MSGQGAAIGAATGATYALATGKDPIKYAMIGGAVGGTGGAMMPTLGAGTAAGTTAAGTAGGTTIAGTGSALTGAGASTAANTAFMAPAGVNPGTMIGASQGAGYTSAAIPSNIFSTPSAVNTAMTPAVERPLTYGMQGVEYGQGGSPTMMERFGQVGQFAQQNPVLSQMAMQGAQSLLQQQPQQPAPAGIMRGSPSQVQMPQYQVGVPKVSLI
jgi:hypothetical protein